MGVVSNLTLLFHTPVFAMVIDDFSAPQTEFVKERGDFVGGGKMGARVPHVKSRLVQDPERGTVLGIDFNVSQGFGGTFLIFRSGRVPARFNVVRFWIRGIHSPFKVELKDDSIHSFIVEKSDRSTWHEIVIPVSQFSNSGGIHFDQIKEFVFVFEDHRTAPRLGQLYVDDLAFVWDDQFSAAEADAGLLPSPSSVSVSGSEILTLASEVPHSDHFEAFRFEGSWDGLHWFYLAELPNEGMSAYETRWDTSRFPRGTYFVRSAVVDKLGNRRESETTEVHIQNEFDVEGFLDEVQRRAFDYFVNEVEPNAYLVRDKNEHGSVYSAGLSGFQFTAYVIGVERGWMDRREAVKRMNRVMDFLLDESKRYNGLIPHWIGPGLREVWEFGMGDVVETSFVLAGGLTAQNYFNGDDPDEQAFRSKVERLYREIDWQLLLKRGKPEEESGRLPWHWLEKAGASKLEVRGYNEGMFVYLLGMGAPANAISERSWAAWASSYQRDRYGPYELIACAPLFTHQYSHLWVDYRGLKDANADYFENSIVATLANREFSLKANEYAPELWGLSASEGPNGYKAYGAPPVASPVPVVNDGTLSPTAAGGSVMFTPHLSIAALKHMRDQYGEKVWGPYGFKDAFNPKMNWFYDGYLGLNLGPILISIENYRSGLIWRLFMQNPYINEGMRKAGFHPDA